MAIGAGMTSAITNPLHVEVVKAVHGRGRHDGPRSGLRALDPRFREPPPARREGEEARAAGAKAAIAGAGAELTRR
jgi:5-methyltetrahydrofolate--homocysteine methyltransferase